MSTIDFCGYIVVAVCQWSRIASAVKRNGFS